MKEKTLYDVLGVGRNANFVEIRAAYEALRQRCEENLTGLSEEDRRIQLVALRQAYETLADNVTKAIYDEKLCGRPLPPTWVAMADAPVALAVEGTTKSSKDTNWMAVGIWVLLGIAGIWLIAQVAYVFIASRYITANPPPADAAARERAVIQDYYQETGVRAASAAEVEMLRLADRQAERERRQEELAAREKDQAQRDYERFVAESKREGDQVSADLHRAEMERKRVEERERREAEEAERRKAEEEAARIERERARWREVLNDRQSVD